MTLSAIQEVSHFEIWLKGMALKCTENENGTENGIVYRVSMARPRDI